MFCAVKVKNEKSFFGFHFSLFTFRKTFFPGKPKNSFFRKPLTVRRKRVEINSHAWQATSGRTEIADHRYNVPHSASRLRRSVPSAVADLTGEITLVRRPVPLLAPKSISMEAVLISSNSCHKEQLYPPLLGIKSQCICDCWHKAEFYLRTIAFQPNYRPATVHIRIYSCSSSGRVSVAYLTRSL